MVIQKNNTNKIRADAATSETGTTAYNQFLDKFIANVPWDKGCIPT